MLDYRTESFLTVCQYMNYTKAAEALSVTQPAITGHIHYLEEYYGVKLFSYVNKKLSLTKQGEYLKNSLQTFYHDQLKLKREVSQIKPKKIYRIGATLSIADSYLPKFLSEYLEAHKDMELSVTVGNTETLLNKIDNGQLDIVLTEGYFSKDKYEHSLISKEPVTIFCGMDYPIDGVEKLEDLFRHRFICREKGSGTRAVFEHYLEERGYSMEAFDNKCDFTNLALITEMLVKNQGISVLYKCVGRQLLEEKKIKEIKLDEFSVTHDFNALWQKNSIYAEENVAFLNELIESTLEISKAGDNML